MYGNALLGAGIGIEVCKRKSIQYYEEAIIWLDKTADAIDDRYGKRYPCLNNMMCQRTGARHKSGCIGKTESFEKYARSLV